jgi:hypothetical protein
LRVLLSSGPILMLCWSRDMECMCFSCRGDGDGDEIEADMLLATFGAKMLLKQRLSAKGRSHQIPND